MYQYRAGVVRVIDGDSLVVDIDLGFFVSVRQVVRLVGIDTPELSSSSAAARALAQAARARLIALLPPEVSLRSFKADPRDKYGRYLADILLPDGRYVSQTLLAEGLAVPYQGGAR